MKHINFYTNVTRYGSFIHYRGYDTNGDQDLRKVKFAPTLFVNAKPDSQSKWTTMDGVRVDPLKLSSMTEATDFIKSYAGMDSYKIYGNPNYVYSFIQELFPGSIQADRSLINTTFIDIETAIGNGFPNPSTADQEILLIGLYSSKSKKYIIFGTGENTKPLNMNAQYIKCDNETIMLRSFIEWWTHPSNTPDILSGWNIRFFDIPYIVNRINRVLGEKYIKMLSPWKMVNDDTVTINKKPQKVFNIVGVETLDYMDLFKKFAYTYGQQESYSLNHISSVVLGESKDDYSDIGTLRDLYENDFTRFINYNIRDVDLVKRLDDKLGLIDIVITMAYMGGVNYTDTLGTTRIWDTIIYRELCKKMVACPLTGTNSVKSDFSGGYVKDPVIGFSEWVASFDFASLYPNIMVQYNMSPETIVKHMRMTLEEDTILSDGKIDLPNTNLAIAANGVAFRRDKKGIIPEIIEKMYDQRVELKNNQIRVKKKIQEQGESPALTREVTIYTNSQTALKILLNSLYGAQSNAHFKYFDLDIATAITSTGRLAVRWAERAVNEYLNDTLKGNMKDRIIAIDTDSLYMCLADVVVKFNPKNPVKFLDEFCSKGVEPAINKSMNRLYEITNGFTKRLSMKREVIADVGLWTAKKRYILNVHNSEGVQYTEPEIKMMGIEAVKSSTPMVCRDAMEVAFKTILSGDEALTQKMIAEFKTKFMQLQPHEIGFPRGVSDVTGYADRNSIYSKGTPIHSRGSLLYNHHLKKMGLADKYRLIKNGDKIKFIYLDPKNFMGENVIAFPDDHLPEELQLHKYIDYEEQFNKTFIAPIKIILDSIKWTVQPVSNLNSFFC